MSDRKPGTSLVPVSSKKEIAAQLPGAGSLVLRRIGELMQNASPDTHPVAMPEPTPTSSIDQSRSKVGGDQVAGDKIDGPKFTGDVLAGNAVKIAAQYNIQLPRSASVVEKLLHKLQHEVEQNIQYNDTIVRLQRYHGGVAHDDIKGLIAKLRHSGREAQIDVALEQKEEFAKLLETWSLYHSAQEIFVYLLARAENVFTTEVIPEIATSTISQINRQINRDIVDPIVDECAVSVLQIDHVSAMGMLYWLAEQCFIRWH
ncbi:ABC-three component system protein [Sphingomonas sp. CJ20]